MSDEPQRIARLTPVDDVLARINALVCQPSMPREAPLAEAVDTRLVREVGSWPHPAARIAIRDGFAVASEQTADASSYAPAPLSGATWVDAGMPMPAEADAVAPLDAIVVRGGQACALAPVVSGEGVLPLGVDCGRQGRLVPEWCRLDPIPYAVLAAAGVERVAVTLRIGIATARAGDRVLDAVCGLWTQYVASHGIAVHRADDLAGALADTDAAIVIGGTGSGRNDASVRTLARMGRVEVHGVALSPGETAAFGMVADKPVLLVPGRLDAALALWVVLGREFVWRLLGHINPPRPTPMTLTRKVASALGMTEVVPVRRDGEKAEPLATGYWPLHLIAQANGWFVVPPDSEGYPEGATVMVRPWL